MEDYPRNPEMVTQEERLMAAFAHIAAIIPNIGVIAPILIWVMQKDKSAYVRFQSLQALFYQLGMILVWIIGFGCYFVSIFSTVGISGVVTNGQGGPTPGFEWMMVGPFAVFGLVLCLIFLYIIYAIIAAIMTFQGKDFRYILIGNLAERAN